MDSGPILAYEIYYYLLHERREKREDMQREYIICITYDLIFYSSGDGEESQTIHSADKLLSGWFCFVQTGEGKVVAIYHSKEDHPSAVNIKKSIAAAFQANFKGTDTEEEVDPQSIHTSHYR